MANESTNRAGSAGPTPQDIHRVIVHRLRACNISAKEVDASVFSSIERIEVDVGPDVEKAVESLIFVWLFLGSN